MEKYWNYSNENICDEYSQNDWNQTLRNVLNEIKGVSLNSEDAISVSYTLKDVIDTLTWIDKPIISYRFDNEPSIYYNNIKIKIENHPFNHQENEEWIESQKNIYLNMGKNTIKGMHPDAFSSKEEYAKLLKGVFSSGRAIEENDVVFNGFLYYPVNNMHYLIQFHIDELKDTNSSLFDYDYDLNKNNKGLLPVLRLKDVEKIDNYIIKFTAKAVIINN